MSKPPPLPPRPRALSHPDSNEVPAWLTDTLKGVQGSMRELSTAVAGLDAKITRVEEVAIKASALSVERWTNLAKALVPAVVAIVGGTVGVQKLTAPSAPQLTQVHESALSAELGACNSLPESNQPGCVGAAYQRDQARRAAAKR